MSVMIGIDLGTSTTEAAVYRNGQPEMILNLEGSAVTPSAVGIDEAGNWVAGSTLKHSICWNRKKQRLRSNA